MKNVVYSHIKPDESANIPIYLKNKANWEPVVFHVDSIHSPGMQKYFPETHIADASELRSGIFNYENLKMRPIDSEIINKLKKFEGNTISSLREAHPGALSYIEKRTYYYNILSYWNTLIIEKKINLFISYTAPHLESDYPLYLLCKYVYDIPVIFLDDYPFFDHYYTFNDNIENYSLIYKDYLKKKY